MFWKTRYEPGLDAAHVPYRTLVSYKETLRRARRSIRRWTRRPSDLDRHMARSAVQPAGRRRPAGKCRDRHDLDGQFGHHRDHGAGLDGPPALLAEHARRRSRRPVSRRWPPRRLATSGMKSWTTARVRPASCTCRRRRSRVSRRIIDYGATVGIGTATHNLTLYRSTAARSVFGAGTVQWAWGLDDKHDRGDTGAHGPTGDAAGDGQPARRHGRAAGDAADRRGSRAAADRSGESTDTSRRRR